VAYNSPISVHDYTTPEELWLSQNSLLGQIPAQFGDLGFLGLLFLSKCDQSVGPVQRIRKRAALWLTDHFDIALLDAGTLKLNGNTLSGQFPANLVNLISLEVLDIGDNQMSGVIPPTIASLASLSEFHDECRSL
jgi:hypothetical protein